MFTLENLINFVKKNKLKIILILSIFIYLCILIDGVKLAKYVDFISLVIEGDINDYQIIKVFRISPGGSIVEMDLNENLEFNSTKPGYYKNIWISIPVKYKSNIKSVKIKIGDKNFIISGNEIEKIEKVNSNFNELKKYNYKDEYITLKIPENIHGQSSIISKFKNIINWGGDYIVFRPIYEPVIKIINIIQNKLISVVLILLFFIYIIFFMNKNNNINFIVIGILLGSAFFFFVFGYKILNVTYIDWLLERIDPSQHILGWLYFQHDPWTFPIGKFTSAGYPEGGNVVFTDSIPILAILFKIFNFILPFDFQYFGMWMLTCYILMGIFSLFLLSKFSDDLFFIILCSVFFIISPVMLFRGWGHEALMAHWLIIAALYLSTNTNFNNYNNFIRWCVLITLSLLIHPYLWAIVLLFYFAYLVDNLINKKIIIKTFIINILIIGFLQLLVMFVVGSISIGGKSLMVTEIGDYSMNINSIFNPLGYSNIIKSFSIAGNGQYEGFNYIGLGVILLMIISLFIILKNKNGFLKRKISITYFIFGIIITIFALSHIICLNGNILLRIPLPDKIVTLLGIFRSSGRFFWIIFYLIYLGIFLIILKYNKRNVIYFVLTIALLIQMFEAKNYYSSLNKFFSETEYKFNDELTSKIWKDIPKKYKMITFIPETFDKNYRLFSYYAVKNNMKTNYCYLARPNLNIVERNKKIVSDFEKGIYCKDMVYIINDEKYMSNKYIQNVDGYNILLP